MIKRISIEKLFGIFNHNIELSNYDNITILHGPNGSGKTMLLKMIDSLVKKDFNIFFDIPFKVFAVTLESMEVKLERIDEEGTIKISSSDESLDDFKIKNNRYMKRMMHHMKSYGQESEMFSRYGAIRIGPGVYSYKGAKYRKEELLRILLSEDYPENSVTQWFLEETKKIKIMYIGAERLTTNNTRKVVEYPNQLRNIISEYFSKYGFISQELDATYPSRIILLCKSGHSVTNEQLMKKHNELTEKTNKFIDQGILTERKQDDIISFAQFAENEFADNDVLKLVLSQTLDDSLRKLSVLEDLLNKITVFETFINAYFENKEIKVSREKGFSIICKKGDQGSRSIEPAMLSSGEQHFLVLIYELVFNSDPNQLVLIDEPEISLHIAWQINLVDNFINISKLKNIQFLLATHSPSIIRNHRKNVVSMGYDGNEE